MNREEIRKTIEGFLVDNWPDTPIAFEDNQFDPEQSGTPSFIRPEIYYSTPRAGEKGEDGVSLLPGSLKVTVFTQVDGGVSDSNKLLDKLDEMFRFKYFNEDKLWTGDPWSLVHGKFENGMYFSVLMIPFWTWKGTI